MRSRKSPNVDEDEITDDEITDDDITARCRHDMVQLVSILGHFL